MSRLLLIGAGHAHAQVLKDWARSPVDGCELTIVSPSSLSPYSGMVPGWLAGVYRYDEICIDFEALALAANARLVIDELDELDPAGRRVTLRSGVSLDYDVLSLNAGSTLTPPSDLHAAHVLSLRPLRNLHAAWESLMSNPDLVPVRGCLQVTTVGGGAAGVEATLATLARLRAHYPEVPVRSTVVTHARQILPGMAASATRSARRALADAGVAIRLESELDDDLARRSDLLLWATGAQAHAWQRASGLAVSERGFIRIDSQLRSVSHPQVHAVGDCAEWATPLPKAGVFAVRMGPVLSKNLRAALGEGRPRRYRPQRRYLVLLATADGSAIGSWGPISFSGRWVWRWKNQIDRNFIARFCIPRRPPSVSHDLPTSGDPA